MSESFVAPSVYDSSFNCPHCSALAHQNWFKTYIKSVERPFIPDPNFLPQLQLNHGHDPAYEEEIQWFKRLLDGVPFTRQHDNDWCNITLEHIFVSQCYSCKKYALWLGEELIYPKLKLLILPNEDLPEHVASDFSEAAAIFETSPRGAAALLRLALQKLLQHLKVPGDKIDQQIASLVADGLPKKIQKALDIVRVVGNSAVHPGQISVEDNRDIALKLFSLLNIIADALITQPNQIDELFDGLPQGIIRGIERRDAPKSIEGPKKK